MNASCTPAEIMLSITVPLHSRSTREGAPDVHHPQTGRPVFPGPQRGKRIIDPFPGILSARPSIFHHGHATGASQPGDERSGHHAGEASHRGSGSAHTEGGPIFWRVFVHPSSTGKLLIVFHSVLTDRCALCRVFIMAIYSIRIYNFLSSFEYSVQIGIIAFPNVVKGLGFF